MPRVTAKICGVSTPDALDAAIAGGASHVGFVFFARSPRNIAAERAAALAERAAGRVKLVGLFVDAEAGEIDAVRNVVPLDVLQLHGGESPQAVAALRTRAGVETWKALPVRTRADLDKTYAYADAADRIVFDAKPAPGADLPGGNGLRFDWALLDGFRHPLPWVLSGGLDADNVAEATGRTGARLVDVSSGVESAPGVKDSAKIAALLERVRAL